MKEIFDKLTSYNIFNYLLPGVIFVCITPYFLGYDFIQENDFLGTFLYYFIGMAISRFGSVVLEPCFKKTKFVKFSDYKDFVSASKKDEKIELFSEVNNTYRTIISLFTLLLLLKGYVFIESKWGIPQDVSVLVLVALILILFVFSYRKQTSYISKRITHFKSNNP